MTESPTSADLFERIRELVLNARSQLHRTVNTAMVQTYWDIGRMIVEEEQAGNVRAMYGRQQLAALSRRLADELGSGFSVSNLKNMRQFYHLLPNRHAVRSELSWTHYRAVMRVENSQAREWYIKKPLAKIGVVEPWNDRSVRSTMNDSFPVMSLNRSKPKPSPTLIPLH